jgi:uncharacterized protein YecT (DUF1311 family)
MSTLRQCGLAAVVAVLMSGAFACSECPRDATDAVADTTTPAMRRDLSSDLRAAELALQQAQDSVDAALGPELAMHLQPIREAFVTYKKEQCEQLKAVFKDGTYGPVVELECLIHLTDSRREFIEEHYDFLEKIGKSRNGRAKAAHRAARTP